MGLVVSPSQDCSGGDQRSAWQCLKAPSTGWTVEDCGRFHRTNRIRRDSSQKLCCQCWLFTMSSSSLKVLAETGNMIAHNHDQYYFLGTVEVSLVCIIGQTCFQMNCKILNSVTVDFSWSSWYFSGTTVMSCCSGSSACAVAPCHLCQLTKRNSVGFSCSCEKSKVLLLDGKCECKFHLLVTNAIFQFSLDKLIKNFDLDLSEPDSFRVLGER